MKTFNQIKTELAPHLKTATTLRELCEMTGIGYHVLKRFRHVHPQYHAQVLEQLSWNRLLKQAQHHDYDPYYKPPTISEAQRRRERMNNWGRYVYAENRKRKTRNR